MADLSGVIRTDVDALLASADALVPAFTDVVAEGFGIVRAAVPLESIEAMLTAGDLDGVEDAIPWDRLDATAISKADPIPHATQLARLIAQAMTDAARAAGVTVAQFRMVNPAAVDQARYLAAQLVKYVDGNTRRTIRNVITLAVRGRYTTRQAALLIRSTVALSPRQAQAVINYANALQDAARTGRPLADLNARFTLADQRFTAASPSPEQQARMVQRYADRQLAYRANMIARTETMKAANQGLLDNWRTAQDQGLLGPGTVKVWEATPDERTCQECMQTDGERVPLRENFSVGIDAPPLHPLCRCTMYLDAK